MEHQARNTKQRIIIAITGASGTQYAIQLIKLLKTKPIEIHLIISDAAKLTANYEVNMPIKEIEALADVVYSNKSIWANIASGSFKTMGMIIIPCSIKTMSQIAYSIGDSLISRAADVCLKEQRKVILVVREAPHHAGHLDHAVETFGLDGKIHDGVIADGRRMHISQMGNIEQVIRNQLVGAGHRQRFAAIAFYSAPTFITGPVPVGNKAFIGTRRIAHPDPDPIPFLRHRIGTDA